MKNIFKILLFSILITGLFSCKKQEFHKIKYTIEFHETPSYGYTNWLELTVTPVYDTEYNYGEHYPSISPTIASNNKYWEYDYWEIEKGDDVQFGLWCASGYYYTLSVYVDEDLVSSKKIYVHETINGAEPEIVEEYGLDNDPDDFYISFNFQ
jgi:hypothetical protein